MKKYYALIFMLAVIFAACKKNNISPPTSKETLIVGSWKWSAQYTNAQVLYTSNPANTGVQETLEFNANGAWKQIKNVDVANTGTYSFINAIVPGGLMGGGTIPFFSIVNSRVNDTARYDNFNFNTGFIGSYQLTPDSLVFFGVNTIDTSSTNYIAERVYVK